jgi:hypothetical protein
LQQTSINVGVTDVDARALEALFRKQPALVNIELSWFEDFWLPILASALAGMSSTTTLCLRYWRCDAVSLVQVLIDARRLEKLQMIGWTNMMQMMFAGFDYTDLPAF